MHHIAISYISSTVYCLKYLVETSQVLSTFIDIWPNYNVWMCIHLISV